QRGHDESPAPDRVLGHAILPGIPFRYTFRACPALSIGITMGVKSRKRPSLEALMGSARIVGIALSAVFVVVLLTGCGKFSRGEPGAPQCQAHRYNRER